MGTANYYLALDTLEKIRKEKNFSQEEMAAFIRLEGQSCTRSYYGQLERGRSTSNLQLCSIITKILGVPVDQIFTSTKEQERKTVEETEARLEEVVNQDPQPERPEHELT